ncbi:MAG TPA: hypothetical protein PLK94_11770 [Alphaproteobacteria bacterium]|nr:hypothetical protein [Alphaproteobacteria bacterium]
MNIHIRERSIPGKWILVSIESYEIAESCPDDKYFPILVIKNLPVDQCDLCSEYLIEDRIMQSVDTMIRGIEQAAELEVRQYAA